MADVISTEAAKRYAVLLTFRWGDNHVARYTNWTDDITRGANVYLSQPKMEIKLAPQHGGADETTPVVVLMQPVNPLSELIKNSAFPRVFVDIQEVDPLVASSRQILFSGTIYKTTKNPAGRTGLIQIECYGARAMMNVPLSIVANATCIATFGDPSFCQKDLGPLKESGTITAIVNKTITVSGLVTTGNSYWKQGWVLFDGLSIMILKYVSGSSMTLKHVPPSSWQSQLCEFTPGCTKELDGNNGCRFWKNEEHFIAPGIKMPAYHPMIDVK